MGKLKSAIDPAETQKIPRKMYSGGFLMITYDNYRLSIGANLFS